MIDRLVVLRLMESGILAQKKFTATISYIFGDIHTPDPDDHNIAA
jgi:hypothetical protein